MDKKLDTDILIAGVGRVGLFLANECAGRKLRYRIIDARATQSEHSNALEWAAIRWRRSVGSRVHNPYKPRGADLRLRDSSRF